MVDSLMVNSEKTWVIPSTSGREDEMLWEKAMDVQLNPFSPPSGRPTTHPSWELFLFRRSFVTVFYYEMMYIYMIFF